MGRKKVLHLLQSDRYSGAENVVCQIIEMFEKSNEYDMVYCSKDGTIRETLKSRNIAFISMKKLCFHEVKRIIKEQEPDIIHAHDFRASVYASLCAGSIPVISHLHNNSPWLKKQSIYSVVYAISCKKYPKILTVSSSVFDEFIYSNKFLGKHLVVGNPINVSSIKLKAKEKKSKIAPSIVYCGRLVIQKNPEMFIDIIAPVMKKLKNTTAVMIGEGELRSSIEKKIREYDLSDRIELLGFVNNPYPIIGESKVMIMPSRWEGFGLVAVEALSLGVPVICSNVGGLPGIVDDRCGKICDTIDEYQHELKVLLSNDKYQSTKAKNALKKADELDNTKVYFETLKGIYNEVTR